MMRLLVWFLFLAVNISLSHSKLVREELTLTWEEGAPNGQVRELIKMNGQFPGPTFYWEENDDIEVLVHNVMPFNTSIHWHGLEMLGTPWADGAVGLTQTPIEIGESFIYRFKAYPSGTYWYHGHIRTMILDGLYGGIYIRPKPEALTPWHLISNDTEDLKAIQRAIQTPEVVVVSDWSHFRSWEYFEAEEAANLNLFCVDSILINGKGCVYCPGHDYVVNHTLNFIKWAIYPDQVTDKGCLPFVESTQKRHLRLAHPENIPLHLHKGCIAAQGDHEVIEVDPTEGWVSINFVDASTLKATVFTIAEHPMWVYEVDGHFIEPQRVDLVQQYAGERYGVLIKLNNTRRDYTIQVADDGISQVISSYATLRYKHRGPDLSPLPGVLDYGGRNITPVTWMDRNHLRPYPALEFSMHSDTIHVFKTQRWEHAWQHSLSGGGMYEEDRTAYVPLLYDPHQRNAQSDNSLIVSTKNGSWVDIIIQVASHPLQNRDAPHTIHKHTTKMWQIGAGMGVWNYSTTAEAIAAQPEAFNFDNPNYRDTFVTGFDGPSWIVMRYHAMNPGPWMLHCHVETHLGAGMAVAILDGIDAWPDVPPEYEVGHRGFHDLTNVDLTNWKNPPMENPNVVQSSASMGNNSQREGSKTDDEKGTWKGFVERLVHFLESWSPHESATWGTNR